MPSEPKSSGRRWLYDRRRLGFGETFCPVGARRGQGTPPGQNRFGAAVGKALAAPAPPLQGKDSGGAGGGGASHRGGDSSCSGVCGERLYLVGGSPQPALAPRRNRNQKYFLSFFFKDIIFREKGREGDRERERNINVCLSPVRSLPGTRPGAQACALTGN